MTEQNEGAVNKALALQLEKNLNILEKDYSLMVFRIQATLSKLTHNNKVLSDIYQEGINQWCDSIENTMGSFVNIVNECEKIEDTLQSVEILSKKISLFKNICETLLKKQAELAKASPTK